MNLSELLYEGLSLPKNASEINIKSIAFDSRKVEKGSIFIAVKGKNFDGHNYISEAISAGASSIVVDKNYTNKFTFPTSKSCNVRLHLALIASKFFKNKPNIISAVTGTNGKTSVCHFTHQIWEDNGFKSSTIGTLGITSSNKNLLIKKNLNSLTTLDPVSLHDFLDKIKNYGIDRVALEASSHGLSQHRIDGLNTSIACFTNLSHDHLDYHKSFKDYKREKFRLFTELLMDGGTAIVNLDDKNSNELLDLISHRDINIITYGRNKSSKWRINEILDINNNKVIRLSIKNNNYLIPTALNSKFQIYNSTAAAAIAYASGIPLENALLSIRNLKSPHGRMQKVPNNLGYNVFVDYAHSPNAIKTILEEQKNFFSRLILVIGCGGNRDISKRAKIGNIASKLCDKIIITDDNPRDEDPSKIRQQIIKGIEKRFNKNVYEIADRKKAISKAIELAKKDDTILIAGKGHESIQIYGNNENYFDDYQEAKKIIYELEK